MSNKLLKNLSLYTLGQFLSQILSIVLLPIYLKELTVEDYGIVASLMATGTFFNAIMQYGMGPTIMRYYYDLQNNSWEFNSFFSSIVSFMLVSNLIIALIISLVYKQLFSTILPSVEMSAYIWYILGYSLCFSVPILNLSLFRVESKPVKFLLFNLVQFSLSFVFIYCLVVIMQRGALGKIQGEFYARIPLFIVGFILFRKYLSIKSIQWKYINVALKYGIPLMFQSLIWWALYKMDYFLINIELGNEGVGYFNVAFQLSFLLITLGISFSLAWTPHFYSIAKNSETPKKYGDLIGNYLFLVIFCASLILVFYKDILYLFNAEKYYGIESFILFLVIGAVFQSTYYIVQQLLFYEKKTKLIPIILGGVLVVVFLLEYLALKYSGLILLSIVKACGFLTITLLTYFVGNKYYSVLLNKKKVVLSIGYFAAIISMISLSDTLNLSIIIKLLLLVGFTLITMCLGFLKKEEKEGLRKLMRIK